MTYPYGIYDFDLEELICSLEFNKLFSLYEFVYYYNLSPARDYIYNDKLSLQWELARQSFQTLSDCLIENRNSFEIKKSDVKSLLMSVKGTLDGFAKLEHYQPLNVYYAIESFNISGIVQDIQEMLIPLTGTYNNNIYSILTFT